MSYLIHASSHLCNLKVIAESMMIAEHVSPPHLAPTQTSPLPPTHIHLSLSLTNKHQQYNSLILELDIFLARYAMPLGRSLGSESDSECPRAMEEMKNDLSESIELLKMFIQNVMRCCQEHVQRNEATDRYVRVVRVSLLLGRSWRCS